MATTVHKVSNEGLGWIKKELDTLLDDARLGLESFINDSTDKASLVDTTRYLFQVQGTLQMVELYGAALLTEEINAVVQAVLDEAVVRQDDALEVLSRAMLSLPDYLEHIQAGNRDIPTVLLPILNDLRTSRNATLLSGEVLFHIDPHAVSVPRPHKDIHATDQDLQQLVKKLRNPYQLGLLHALRGDDVRQGYAQMGAVLARLCAESRYEPARRLWWLGEALAEAVCHEGLEVSVTVNSLFGQIDRQLHSVITNGETLFADSIPVELLRNLLYYLAIAENTGGAVEQVKIAWSLDDVILQEAQLDKIREQLAGPNFEVLKTVSIAVQEDLADVKDQLEIYIHSDARNSEQLDGLQDKLQSIASTLSMLGLEESQHAVIAQADVVAQIHDGEIESSDTAILNMARVMLEVEAAIEGIIDSRTSLTSIRSAQEFDEFGENVISASQFSKISKIVVIEAQRDMAEVKETLVEFVADPDNTEILMTVPDSLERIKGALSIMRIESLTPILDSLLRFIRHDLINCPHTATSEEFEALADTVASIEFYLESLQNPAGNRDRILDLGYEGVANLGYAVPVSDVDTSDQESIEQEAFTAIEHELVADHDTPQYVRMDENTDEILMDPESIDSRDNQVLPVPGLEAIGQENSVSDNAEKKNSTDLATIDPELDEDILEVFVEEAEEQHDTIRDQLGVWRKNPDDAEALSTLRRGYHTLKGSGRLVGAERLGEFAWALENMLNSVIENRVQRSEAMLEVLENATESLPQLLAQITEDTSLSTDIDSLMAAAQRLSRGESLEVRTDQAEIEETATESSGEVESKHPVPDVPTDSQTTADVNEPESMTASVAAGPEFSYEAEALAIKSELLQIYLSEAGMHTDILERILGQDAPIMPVDDLIRALHTLKGASLTANVTDISDLCGPLETYAYRLKNAGENFTVEAHSVYVRTTEALREILASLGAGQQPNTDIQQLQQEINALLCGTDASVSTALPLAESLEGQAGSAGDAEALSSEADSTADVSDGEAVDSLDRSGDVAQPTASREQGVPDIPAEQDDDLVEIFLEEAEDILMACDDSLAQWRNGNDVAEQLSELKRQLHTIKGGARMSGFTNIGDLSHAMETAIIRFADENNMSSNQTLLKSLQQSVDRLHIMLEDVSQSEPVYPASDLIAYFESFPESSKAVSTETPQVEESVVQEDSYSPAEPSEKTLMPESGAPVTDAGQEITHANETADESMSPSQDQEVRKDFIEEIPALDQEKIQAAFESARIAARQTTPPVPASASAKAAAAQEMIRVNADLLDSLVNNAGEVNIYQSRFTQQTHSYGYNLMELEQTVMRLRDQLRKMEIETEAQILFRHERDADTRHTDFDPLELDRYSTLQHLSRALGESVNDLVSIKDILLELVRDSETLLSQQSRVSTELQEGLMRTRMVQFSGVIPRLRRIVRQTSDELAKQVELEVMGEHNEVDRSVLNRMVAPLEHLLRNAISHGIESPEVRDEAGKRRTGKIRISITREGAEVVMRVSDDGAGIDRTAVLEKARKLKMISKRQKLTDNDILGLILEPGFSTATTVTQIAGRGVGMDVVDSEIKQLGGVLNIESEPGEGTRFIIRLPFTLAITHALLVQSGEEMYCLPLASIEGVVRLSVEELAEKYQQTSPVYQYANQSYELMHLGDLLGHSKPVLDGPEYMFPVLLVRSGDNRIALQVEALQGNREIVLKPIGKQLSKVRGISGATILGDGRVVLVLDITGLVRLGAGIHIFGSSQDEIVKEPEKKTSSVMVVDDSITIRKITSRLLERNHYTVMTAKDGVDAVTMLQEQLPDLILLDIEMPRMDGFELAMHIRNSERLKHIPIIMITSRTGDKHKNRAQVIGVNDYLGKPYKEPELLETIQRILQPESLVEEQI